MGKSYKKQSNTFDDEVYSGRAGKHTKHANGKKTGGMKTLNSFSEDDYDDPFEDDIELDDEVFIQHTKDTN